MTDINKGAKKTRKEWVMPTTTNEIQQIQNAIKEASNALAMIEAQKEHIKAIADVLKEELGMPSSKFNQQVKIYHNQNFSQVVAENEEKMELYIRIHGDPDKTA